MHPSQISRMPCEVLREVSLATSFDRFMESSDSYLIPCTPLLLLCQRLARTYPPPYPTPQPEHPEIAGARGVVLNVRR